MSDMAKPAVFKISSALAKIDFICAVTSPSIGWLLLASRATRPEMNSVLPV
jgi:hypothetical protein